ncbi:AraC family transcriptional regulator [Cohnella suwonensis]|uniref:AraC family transcriptional regulator n=1 Tax=Cohnella suwonensis TaxID=696072 RepID=A0ABW0M1N8_9BACL
MNLLEFTVPPLPYYIASGRTVFQIGEKHVSRRNIRLFDLLVVTKGCLYMGEEVRHYEVTAGKALILRPDCYHYATEGCREPTDYFWLHFQASSGWAATDSVPLRLPPKTADASDESLNFSAGTFPLLVPQCATVVQPGKMEELLGQIAALGPEAHLPSSRFKEQTLFQDVLRLLSASVEAAHSAPATACAEQAAAYLRSHYKEAITAQALGETLNFHPVYVARCMNREYGQSPTEYLLRYRVEQSKLLLMQTDLPIARIAEETGFNQAAYFSSRFQRVEGISPRQYRQRFSLG